MPFAQDIEMNFKSVVMGGDMTGLQGAQRIHTAKGHGFQVRHQSAHSLGASSSSATNILNFPYRPTKVWSLP